ncbi:hypothetical protein B0H19DRAFT_1162646 [Mycena capillaripes]|nr:hypothetical protein B0H19DRAFT_1162646 [Mycena capillaripes]
MTTTSGKVPFCLLLRPNLRLWARMNRFGAQPRVRPLSRQYDRAKSLAARRAQHESLVSHPPGPRRPPHNDASEPPHHGLCNPPQGRELCFAAPPPREDRKAHAARPGAWASRKTQRPAAQHDPAFRIPVPFCCSPVLFHTRVLGHLRAWVLCICRGFRATIAGCVRADMGGGAATVAVTAGALCVRRFVNLPDWVSGGGAGGGCGGLHARNERLERNRIYAM